MAGIWPFKNEFETVWRTLASKVLSWVQLKVAVLCVREQCNDTLRLGGSPDKFENS